jgi:hypothetical protein
MTDETLVPETTQTAEITPPKKTRQMSFSVLEDGHIRADFGEGIDPILLNPLDVPESLRLAAVTDGLISRMRGYTSRLQDSARTPAALADAVTKAITALKSGVWKIEREASTTEFSQEIHAAFLFRQMRAAKKNEDFSGSIEEAAENWNALTDEQKKKVKALPLYQQALAEIKAKFAAAKATKLAKKVDSMAEDEAGF